MCVKRLSAQGFLAKLQFGWLGHGVPVAASLLVHAALVGAVSVAGAGNARQAAEPRPVRIHLVSQKPVPVSTPAARPVPPKETPRPPARQPTRPQKKVDREVEPPRPVSARQALANTVPDTAPLTATPAGEPSGRAAIAAPPSPAPAPPAPGEGRQQALAIYLGQLKEAIASARTYPPLARRYRLQGNVEVKFRVRVDGVIEDITILKTSGHEILDEAARNLIVSLSGKFPFPPQLEQTSVVAPVTLKYQLEG